VVLLCILAASLAHANNLTHVQHVIVVIQENRTPTNLFQQDQTLRDNGAHIVTQAFCHGHLVPLTPPSDLHTCWDPRHTHLKAWIPMWDHGNMDGACDIPIAWQTGNGGWCGTDPSSKPSCVDPGLCPYIPVRNAPFTGGHVLDPYFQIANQYGYANYMFSTGQGPSYPGHQFLLSGTSAPDAFNLDTCGTGSDTFPCYQWFAAENNVNTGTWGCTSSGANIWEVAPNGDELLSIYNNGAPCYHHSTLVYLLDHANPSITWKYYARDKKGLWTAPNSIYDICVPSQDNTHCTGQDWTNNVAAVLPDQGIYDSAPILDDIAACRLPQVSWVIPDGNWSDHAGGSNTGPADGGPSWVAAIVNAIGQDTRCEGGAGYWSDTVILVTWDDWGGYYDDVAPPNCGVGGDCGYSNGTGGKYVYGFRVPLLVVGAYVQQVTQQGGYISGANVYPPVCAPPNTYCHDFGSILNFIEYAFGTGSAPLGGVGGISPDYNYADVLVMDKPQSPPNNYSLYDFFDFTTFHNFRPISGVKYQPSCFQNPGGQGCFTTYPVDPDNDANETD